MAGMINRGIGGLTQAGPRGTTFAPGGYQTFQGSQGAQVGQTGIQSSAGGGQHAAYQIGARANSMYVYGPEDERGDPTMVYSPQDQTSQAPSASPSAPPSGGSSPAALTGLLAAGGASGGVGSSSGGTDTGMTSPIKMPDTPSPSQATSSGETAPDVQWLMGQGSLRSGIGQRTMPQYSQALAGLGRIY